MKKNIWQELLKYHFCLDDFFPYVNGIYIFFSPLYIFVSLFLLCIFHP